MRDLQPKQQRKRIKLKSKIKLKSSTIESKTEVEKEVPLINSKAEIKTTIKIKAESKKDYENKENKNPETQLEAETIPSTLESPLNDQFQVINKALNIISEVSSLKSQNESFTFLEMSIIKSDVKIEHEINENYFPFSIFAPVTDKNNDNDPPQIVTELFKSESPDTAFFELNSDSIEIQNKTKELNNSEITNNSNKESSSKKETFNENIFKIK